MHLYPFPVFSLPSPLPICHIFSICCFHFRSREKPSRRQKALLPVLSQNELHSNSKSCCCGCTGPKIPGNILLRCSLKTCGNFAHSIPTSFFVEFPKWMKSRFIWTVLKSETLTSLSLYGSIFLTVQTQLWKGSGRERKKSNNVVLVLWEKEWTNNKTTQLTHDVGD